MEIYTVSFFGHRQLDDFMGAERRLEKLIRELLAEREYVEFLVGRNGDFDQLAASTVLRLKRTVRDDNSSLVLVLPYLTAEYVNNRDSFESYYDEIEVKSPFRLLRSKGHNYAGEKDSRCCLPEKGCRNLRVPIPLFQKSLKSAYLYPWPLYFRLRICICCLSVRKRKRPPTR